MAVSSSGRPHSGRIRETEVVAIPVPHWHKIALEDEARAAGCRSLAGWIRLQMNWPDVSRHMGPKPKTREVHQA